MARGFEISAKPFANAGIIPVVIKGLSQPSSSVKFSEEIVVEVAWLLSFLTAREEAFVKLLSFTLKEEIRKATYSIKNFTYQGVVKDPLIPLPLLIHAKGIAVCNMTDTLRKSLRALKCTFAFLL